MTLPIRARLALVCAGLVASLVVALGAVVYLRLESDLLHAVDDELLTRAEAHVAEVSEAILSVTTTDVGDIFAQRVTRDGRVVATSPGLIGRVAVPGADLAALAAAVSGESLVETTDEPVLARLLAMPAPDGTVVIVGVTIDDQRAALRTLLVELGFALPIAIVLAAGVGWFVAGAALRPVERMRVEAEAVSGSEPDRRLPVPDSRDELAALGGSLNRMMDRLQAAVERERRFVDDASHELRTPLANLQTELDLALRRSRTEAELTAALRSAAEETIRLANLAEDLLVLARADGGRLPIRRESIDVGALVGDAANASRTRAGARSLTLAIATPERAIAALDPTRIRQVVANLVDNAIRHTPDGGRVDVAVIRDASGVVIVVADTGEGFPPSFLPHAFEPFSRGEAARSRIDGGAGLGLAIVQAIVVAHGGSATAANRPAGGASVEVRLPA